MRQFRIHIRDMVFHGLLKLVKLFKKQNVFLKSVLNMHHAKSVQNSA